MANINDFNKNGDYMTMLGFNVNYGADGSAWVYAMTTTGAAAGTKGYLHWIAPGIYETTVSTCWCGFIATTPVASILELKPHQFYCGIPEEAVTAGNIGKFKIGGYTTVFASSATGSSAYIVKYALSFTTAGVFDCATALYSSGTSFGIGHVFGVVAKSDTTASDYHEVILFPKLHTVHTTV